MNVLEAIRAELVASAAVTALVGQRIYPQLMPQGSAHPAVVMTVVSSNPINSLGGTAETRTENSRLQVDVFAKTYLAAHGAAEAIDSVIANLQREDLSAHREVLQDLYDNETSLHRVSMDFSVFK